jgi:hypothetical protein
VQKENNRPPVGENLGESKGTLGLAASAGERLKVNIHIFDC